MSIFNPVQLIEEVKKRPGLYSIEHPVDREEKLALWKEIGSVIYHNWNDYNKANAYDKVLQLQRKWRSLRDAYNRELRSRRSGVRLQRRVYRYFKRMTFLGGYDGELSEDDDDAYPTEAGDDLNQLEDEPPVAPARSQPSAKQAKKTKKRKRKRESSTESLPTEEIEMPIFPVEMNEGDSDSDKLFFLSFLPEMKKLPTHIKMWVRAQVANIMQEAVTAHYNNTTPSFDKVDLDIKRQRIDSSD